MACVGGIRPGLLFVFDQRFGQQGARFLDLTGQVERPCRSGREPRSVSGEIGSENPAAAIG
jgi:hypothetical protein